MCAITTGPGRSTPYCINSKPTPKSCALPFAMQSIATLDKEYEDQTGDEAIAEFAAGNDYTFTISGQREG